jgi:hypothetical protein
MNIKPIKLTFLIFAGLVIISFSFFSMAQESSTSDKNIFLDSDQDGLSDSEEKTYGTDPQNRDTDGDGYTDGTEIKSGYDPLKHAPGDKLINDSRQLTTENKEVITIQREIDGATASGVDQNSDYDGENLTQKVSAGVANLVSTSGEEGKEISLDDLDTLVNQITTNTLTFDDLPDIDEESIKIKKQNYSKLSKEKREEKEKQDTQEYLISVSYILISNSPQKISDKSDIESLSQQVITQTNSFASNLYDISYFEDLAERGEKILEQTKEVEVPENLLDTHKKGLKIANYAVSLKDTARPDPNDPVGTITKLSKVQELISLSEQYAQELMLKFTGLELSGLPISF